ncbi:MAG: galactose oxidase [Bacteroidetes bacterium]|nr:galactose oxidase [Bacteroidota bacterium]
MKKIFTLTLPLFFTFLFVKADFWTQKADFPGICRQYPFSFSIGNKGFFGGGRDSTYNNLYDFWEYDSGTNIWTQKANYAGSSGFVAVGFSINDKGYAGTGLSSNNSVYYQDFWEYDPTANTWTQKANYGGGDRAGIATFTINGKGYLATGRQSTAGFVDLWQYDPQSNLWTQKSDFPGTPRWDANCFTIGNSGYMIGGYSFSSGYVGDVYEYNSISDSWTQKLVFCQMDDAMQQHFQFAIKDIMVLAKICQGCTMISGNTTTFRIHGFRKQM